MKFTRSTANFDTEVLGPELHPQLQSELDNYSQTDRVEGTTRTKEGLAELQEDGANKAQEYKFDNQEEFYLEQARKGKVMSHSEFIRKLRHAGLKCWYNPVPVNGLVGLRAIRPGYEQAGLQYVCAVQLGLTTEYEMLHFDARGLPLNSKYRGWRTVLLNLVLKGFLTEEQVNKEFGKAYGLASERYNRTLYCIRNRRSMETHE